MNARASWLWALAVALVGAAACTEDTPAGPSFAFNRPERVAFACIDPDGNLSDPDSLRPMVLPIRCCAVEAPLADPNSPFTQECPYPDAEPALHALVTQSTRGEVAAVDLESNEVLDSDRLIPGFTFVNVGGEPTAIVVPPVRPFAEEQPETDGGTDAGMPEAPAPDLGDGGVAAPPAPLDQRGPPWTYVASAENQVVVAIPTCVFRVGEACGPEGAPGDDTSAQRENQQTVVLPAAPADMILGPDFALWVSLPDLGALARIALPVEPPPAGDWPPAFVIDPATDMPMLPQLFGVPDASGVQAPDASVESPEYVAACGQGAPFVPNVIITPPAPTASSEGAVRPTRLRFDPESGLLFVGDESQPVIHTFSIADGALVTRGALAIGAPVRDFALTNAVPAVVPPLFVPSDPNFVANAPAAFGPDEKRYLYALDNRDGSLLAFALNTPDPGVGGTPLVAPEPSVSFDDRIRLDGVGAALDVIDTRVLSPEVCGAGFNASEVPDDDDRTLADVLEDQESDLRAAIPDDQEDDDPALAQLLSRLAIARGAVSETGGAAQLRGVFVTVATLQGDVWVVDVHDLDVFCRAWGFCAAGPLADGSGGLEPRESNDPGVAVRRHAARLLRAGEPDIVVSDTDALNPAAAPGVADGGVAAGEFACPDGYFPRGDSNDEETDPRFVCTPQDPSNSRDIPWSVDFEGSIPGLASESGALGEVIPFDADEATIELQAPAGTNYCGRGVYDSQIVPMYGGDTVVFVGAPDQFAPSDCDAPLQGQEPTLTVVEAFSDRLVLRGDIGVVQTLHDCFPGFASYEVRVTDSYLVLGVLGGGALYLHRVIANEEGRCVLDDRQDPRLTSRADDGVTFVNPYVAFQLIAMNREDAEAFQMSVTVTNSHTVLQRTLIGDPDFGDSRPASVRYFPYTNELFVVDSASQGLRRFGLSPFERDTSPIQ